MKDFFRRNGFWLLVIAFLLSVLIGISTVLMGGNADPLSDLVSTITAPIRGGVSAVADWAGGVSRYVLHYGEMEQELQDLEKKVAELEGELGRGRRPFRRTPASGSCWACKPSARISPLNRPRSRRAPPTTGGPPSP